MKRCAHCSGKSYPDTGMCKIMSEKKHGTCNEYIHYSCFNCLKASGVDPNKKIIVMCSVCKGKGEY